MEEESSDDDQEWKKRVKLAHKNLKKEKEQKMEKPVVHSFKAVDDVNQVSKKKTSKKSLEGLLQNDNALKERSDGHQMVFKVKKSRKQILQEEQEKEHRRERQEVRRSAAFLKKDKIKPKFWNGKRVI